MSGAVELWIQGKDMTQQFAGTLRRKQGGRFIGISIHKYLSTSKLGTRTTLPSLLVVDDIQLVSWPIHGSSDVVVVFFSTTKA